MFNVDAIDEIVELGYRFARETLEKTPWKPESGPTQTA